MTQLWQYLGKFAGVIPLHTQLLNFNSLGLLGLLEINFIFAVGTIFAYTGPFLYSHKSKWAVVTWQPQGRSCTESSHPGSRQTLHQQKDTSTGASSPPMWPIQMAALMACLITAMLWLFRCQAHITATGSDYNDILVSLFPQEEQTKATILDCDSQNRVGHPQQNTHGICSVLAALVLHQSNSKEIRNMLVFLLY